MKEKILIVDDDKFLIDLVKNSLEKEGYKIISASDGNTAIKLAMKEKPDLIILDILMPEIDGFEVCYYLQKKISAPIIMLTAKDDVIDKIVGLEVGADDYITKPFNLPELVARVKSALRRSKKLRETREEKIVIKKLELNLETREVKFKNKKINLTPKEFQLLELFMRNNGKVFKREYLLDKIWGEEKYIDSRTVDVTIKRLREKLNPNFIVTVWGVGYKFIY
jgi:two-component system response regulator VicR